MQILQSNPWKKFEVLQADRSVPPLHGRSFFIVLVSVVCAGCGKQATNVDIDFVARFGEQFIDCSTDGVALTDLRLFVSEPELRDLNGRWHRAKFVRNEWQTPQVALLDLETGNGRCANGTPATNTRVTVSTSAATVGAVRFTVGVPFGLNHADPLQAPPPLNIAAMHWHWRSGYKFLRAGIGTQNDGFWLHLGSTGCEGTVRNITGCSAPNRVQVQLDEFKPNRDRVAIDLQRLAEGSDLTDASAGDCSSGPAEQSCTGAFGALALPFADAPSAEQQSVFRVDR